jgi:hypothetical protein
MASETTGDGKQSGRPTFKVSRVQDPSEFNISSQKISRNAKKNADRLDPAETWHEQTSGLDKKRLQTDHEYLLCSAVSLFQKHDKYHRGMLTSRSFQIALKDLGLSYGQKEVDDILQYCTITDDGFLHYKELQHLVAPRTPRAKTAHIKELIYPAEESDLRADMRGNTPRGHHHDHSQGMLISDGFTERAPEGVFPERGAEVQRLYAKWQLGRITDAQFKNSLEAIGLVFGREAENMIRKSAGARTLNYSKFASLLQVDEDDGRRARNHVGTNGHPRSHHGDRSDYGHTPRSGTPREHRSSTPRSGTPRSERSNVSEASVAPLPASMRKIISDFVDGRMSSSSLRKHLRRHGVILTQELERLILQHESDNKVNFRDIARLVMRQGDPDPHTDSTRASSAGPGCGGFPWERSRSSVPEYDGEELEGRGPPLPPWDTTATSKTGVPHLFLQNRGKKYFSERAIRGLSELQGTDVKTGKYLAWPEGQAVSDRPLKNRVDCEMAHVLEWNENQSHRLQRSRSLGPQVAAAPYGRCADAPPPQKHHGSIAKPFGTSRDERVRTDQVGTVEYLPADQRRAMNRDYTPPKNQREGWNDHHASPLHGNKYFGTAPPKQPSGR